MLPRCSQASRYSNLPKEHDFLDDHVVRELTMNLYVKGQVNVVAPAASRIIE
jgi:hypothetical protein